MDLYLSFVSALQYVYVRNYVSRAIVKRVSLLHFPTCLALADFNALYTHEDQLAGEQVLAVIGTREGKVLTYKISSTGSERLAETSASLSFGGIAAVDVSVELDKLVASTDAGELFTAEIVANIRE